MAQPATMMPTMESRRWAITPKTMEFPVMMLTMAASPKATGPYGDGEFAQINGTERASSLPAPKSCTGPAE